MALGRYGAIVRRDDFIPPLPIDEADFFRRATVVLDTNVLLAPYKLSAVAREDALRAIESSAHRLWLPHQVGVEFYRNHASNRDLRSKAYEDAIGPTAQFEQLVTKHLGKGTTHEDLRKSVARVVREAVSTIKAEIDQLRLADTAITAPDADDVRERIEAAFAGKAAAAPNPTTIRERTEEFTSWRVPSRIPPGFEDRGKPGEARSAGDFLIWAEILEHAASNNLDVLFVTEDGKDDWWEAIDGQRRPHRALALEFQRATRPGRQYHQVSMETFVRLATKAAGEEAEQSSLNEIEAVGQEAEVASRIATLNAWLASPPPSLAPPEERLQAYRSWTTTLAHVSDQLRLSPVELSALWTLDPVTKRNVLKALARPTDDDIDLDDADDGQNDQDRNEGPTGPA